MNGLFDLAKAESLVLHPEAEEVFQSCIYINEIAILTLSVRCGGKVLCSHQQVMPSAHASPHKTLHALYFQTNAIAHMLDGSTDENKPFSGRHRKSSFLETLKKHKKNVRLISREGYQSSGLYFYSFHFSMPTKPEEHIVKTVFDDKHKLYKNQGMEKLLMQAAVAAYSLWVSQQDCQLITEMVYHHLIAPHTYLCLKTRPMDNTGHPRITQVYPVYSRRNIPATFKYPASTEEMVA